MGDLFQAFLKSPDMTQACASLALIVAATTLVWGTFRVWWWRRATYELRRLRDSLNKSELSTRNHRALYRSFNDSRQLIRIEAEQGARGLQVVDDLLSEVSQYHRAAATGGSQGWDEIAYRFLQRRGRLLRITRAAASWAVLMGLAGTVLGFVEAIPALRDTLSVETQLRPDNDLEPPSQAGQPGESSSTDKDDSVLSIARGNLVRVLDSLGGVFFATFFGVISALVLYMAAALVFEPIFEAFSGEVELLGQRWFVPLIETPATILDETLRNELQEYFHQVGEALDKTLSPLVKSLSVNLSRMSDVAAGFSENIETGRDTLATFHTAVEKLGRTAGEAVGQVVGIVQTSKGFLQEVRDLQEEGGQRLTQAVAKFVQPTAELTASANSIRLAVDDLSPQIQTMADRSQEIANAVQELSQSQLGKSIEASLKQLVQSVEAGRAAATITPSQGFSTNDTEQLRSAVQDLRHQMLLSSAASDGEPVSVDTPVAQSDGDMLALHADQIRILKAVRDQLGRMGRSLGRIEEIQTVLLNKTNRRPIRQAVHRVSRDLTAWGRSPVLRWLKLVPRRYGGRH